MVLSVRAVWPNALTFSTCNQQELKLGSTTYDPTARIAPVLSKPAVIFVLSPMRGAFGRFIELLLMPRRTSSKWNSFLVGRETL
jgi:hypothetical protein